MAAGAASAAAARLIWSVVPGLDFDDVAERRARQGFGGYVLGSPNLRDPDQIRRLTGEIRRASPVPVRLAVDQEGGHVYRIGPPLTRFPGAMAIGATGSARLAYEAARATALELRSVGIDTVHAPVLDVALEPYSAVVGVRAYGSDAALVSRLGAAAVRGYLAGGAIPVAKHFPGHGGTAVDTHLDTARDRYPADVLDSVHLAPYRAAIAAHVPALMTSHVTYDGLGDGLPASISAAAIAGLARERLGFDGFIVTDALVMDAIRAGRDIGEVGVRVLEAEVDAVMAMHYAEEVVGAIEGALASGRLPEAAVATALRRVTALDRLAWRLARRGSTLAEPLPDWIAHRELADRIARASLTLVRDRAVLPIDPARPVLLLELVSRRSSPVEERNASDGDVSASLARRLPQLLSLRVRHDDVYAAGVALEAASRSPLTIVATRDAYRGVEERAFLHALNALNVPLVVVALRSPVDLSLVPDARASIATYTDVPATCEALAEALVAGPRSFPGRLPMTLPTDDEEIAA